MILQTSVEFRHYGRVVARYGHDSELCPERDAGRKFGNLHVKDRGVVLQLEHSHLQFPPSKIHGFRRSGTLEQTCDFAGRNLLGIEHKINAKFREQVFVLERKILLVIYAGAYFLAAEFLCQKRTHKIHVLRTVRVYCNEKVCMFHPCILQYLDAGQIW